MIDKMNGIICILQQNVNGSNTAQAEVVNTNHNKDVDIIALQEPYIDFKGSTRASREWVAIYPTNTSNIDKGKTRAIMLISVKIKSDTWEEIKTNSNDLTIIKIRSELAKTEQEQE